MENLVKTINDNYLEELKRLPKDHLFTNKNPIDVEYTTRRANTYNPQVGDLVYYFIQGHEEYMSQYSCHFFSGLNSRFQTERFMPWLSLLADKFVNERFVLCRVITVDTLFPSRREMVLMSQYGADATTVNQTPQIIQ